MRPLLTLANLQQSILDGIKKAYGDELKARGLDKTWQIIDGEHDENAIRLDFWNTKGKHYDNSTAFVLQPNPDHPDTYDLELVNQYLPETLKGQGFTTGALQRVRHIRGLSGRARPVVGLNQTGWRKIIERAGFEFYTAPVHPMFLRK